MLPPMLKLLLGAVCIGFAPIFVRLLHLGPTPIGMYRCGVACALLFGWILSSRRPSPVSVLRYPRRIWALLVLAGALFALDLFIWHRSVLYAGAGMGTILGNTQVFYVALIGIFFYREKPTVLFLCSVVLAFGGVSLLVNGLEASHATEDYHWGVAFGLGTGLVYANYILTMRQIEKSNTTIPTEYALAFVSFFSAFFLFWISLFEGTLSLPQGMDWLWLGLLAFVAQVMGWLLITKNLAKAPVSKAGLILNAQPVVAVIAGEIILQESLTGTQVCGALLTLIAIYLGTLK